MIFNINKFSRNFPLFGVMTPRFSKEEIEQILFLEKVMTFKNGEVGDNSAVQENIRNCKLSWIALNESTEWIYNKIGFHAGEANYDLFNYDITALEALQYTKYIGSDSSHYTWHFDIMGNYSNMVRKFTGVLMLSDPSEYDGGNLKVIINGDVTCPNNIRLNKGEIAWFDSTFPHTVEPVTSGCRRCIVIWALGPNTK